MCCWKLGFSPPPHLLCSVCRRKWGWIKRRVRRGEGKCILLFVLCVWKLFSPFFVVQYSASAAASEASGINGGSRKCQVSPIKDAYNKSKFCKVFELRPYQTKKSTNMCYCADYTTQRGRQRNPPYKSGIMFFCRGGNQGMHHCALTYVVRRRQVETTKMFLGPFFLLPLLSMGPTLYLFFIFKINCMRVNSVRACLCFPNQLHLGESAVRSVPRSI